MIASLVVTVEYIPLPSAVEIRVTKEEFVNTVLPVDCAVRVEPSTLLVPGEVKDLVLNFYLDVGIFLRHLPQRPQG